MPTSFTERVDLTSAIKSILDSYPLGNGLLRELLQNSDDAGATIQTFVLDRRTHKAESLIDPEALAYAQGPALLCINDTVFRPSDWKALSTIHNSNKTADQSKIGKFGLGFRSSYNVTDNPQVLSGDVLVIFDPHYRFVAVAPGGTQLDFVNERHEYTDQLEAFKPFLADPTKRHNGTIVRLPLRTQSQAHDSKISKKVASPDDIRELFREFIETELEIAMLFLKHVATIELREISPSGENRLLGKVQVDNISAISLQRAFICNHEAKSATFPCRISLRAPGRDDKITTWRIYHCVRSAADTASLLAHRLDRDASIIESELDGDKLFSHVALAIPLDRALPFGRLFTLLPLPMQTNFPLHAHGILALTPDRQNLRAEHGTGKDSRERLLVEWNKAVFEVFMPSAWTELLRILVEQDHYDDVWSAWPVQQSPDVYWTKIAGNLAEKVLSSGLPICPAISNTGQVSEHVALKDAVVAFPDGPDLSVLRVLARVGLAVIRPPSYVCDLVRLVDHRAANPSQLRQLLLARQINLEMLDAVDKDVLLCYLIRCSQSLDTVVDLLLIPLVDGSRGLLGSYRTNCYRTTFVSKPEEDLFSSSDSSMISIHSLPLGIQSYFTANHPTVAIDELKPCFVEQFLRRKFMQFNPAEDEVVDDAEHTPWLAQFWAWTTGWRHRHSLLEIRSVQMFHLLPTAMGTLRKVESGILSPSEITRKLYEALMQLGVPFLHSTAQSATSMPFVHAVSDVSFILNHINASKIPQMDAATIQAHFMTSISRVSSMTLSIRQREIYSRLHIFPTLQSGCKTTKRLGPATGKVICIAESCPLPYQANTTYIDTRANVKGRNLIALLDREALRNALTEPGIIELALPLLPTQSEEYLGALVPRLIRRLGDLSQAFQNAVGRTPFMVTDDGGKRAPPNVVVDPSCVLAQLYAGEVGRFPGGISRAPNVLVELRRFMIWEVTADVIKERIQYLAKAQDFGKATTLLRLLNNTSWNASLSLAVQSCGSVAWLPAKDRQLSRSDQCRDSKDQFLFDQVFRMTDVQVQNDGLRRALGWADPIPLDVLSRQFIATVETGSLTSRGNRVITIIQHLSRRSLTTPEAKMVVECLRESIHHLEWFPITPTELISARHVVLQEDGVLPLPFRYLPRTMKTKPIHDLLCLLGCTDRPSRTALTSELHHLSVMVPAPPQVVATALQILGVLVAQGSIQEGIPQLDVLVPNDTGKLIKVEELYYNDQDDFYVNDTDRVPVHSDVRKSLATALGIPCLSSLQLEDNELDGGRSMGEDYNERISSILQQYSITYAINEFLANAADAGAKKFHILLDERSYEGSRLFASSMAGLQHGPALVLYNDAMFTQNDFDGLCRTGEGGKRGDMDKIGRFGLGALSLFHFSDVVTLVSAGHFMILDPSGHYLPRNINGTRRSVLYMPLASIYMRYPDQLLPFEALFGFRPDAAHYEGTLFRLPLRRPGQPSSISSSIAVQLQSDCMNLIMGSYGKLACNALLFTRLDQISAHHQTALGESSTLLWCYEKTVDDVQSQDSSSSTILSISGAQASEKWMVTRSQTSMACIPSEHLQVLADHKLVSTYLGIGVGLALCLSDQRASDQHTRQHSLFSTLQLPLHTVQPLHVHAQFALAPDRRSIRLDPPDSSGHRIPESAYNTWVLSELVVPLYMRTLEYVLQLNSSPRTNMHWWPKNAGSGHVNVDAIICTAFYNSLPDTRFQVFRTVSGQTLPPKKTFFPDEEAAYVTSVLKQIKASNFADPPIRAALRSLQLQRVTPEFLHESIRNNDNRFVKAFSKSTITIEHIDAVIQFLLKPGHPKSPLGLPLLVQSNETVITFTGDTEAYYAPASAWSHNVLTLFPPSRLLHSGYSAKTLELLSLDTRLAIEPFGLKAIIDFISSHFGENTTQLMSAEDCLWIRNFWREHEDVLRQAACDITVFRKIPLLRIDEGQMHVSIDHLSENTKYFLPPTNHYQDHPWLPSALKQLGVTVIREPAFHLDALSVKRVSIISLMQYNCLDATEWHRLSAGNQVEVANWIRGYIYDHMDDLSARSRSPITGLKKHLLTLQGLPVWDASGHGIHSRLVASYQTKVLPSGIRTNTLLPYLAPSVMVSEHSTGLLALQGRETLKNADLLQLLHFPEFLNTSTIQPYRDVLRTLLQLGRITDLVIPDGNLKLVPVNSLYDSSVRLFQVAFANIRAESFVHEDFRQEEAQLRPLGLRSDITAETFLACARRIDADLRANRTLDPEGTADIAYETYMESLPNIILAHAMSWTRLDTLRFIRRLPSRRRGWEGYDPERYCELLPSVISPSELVRPEDEAIAWTQRGIFMTPPSSQLLRLHPSLGEPTIKEVIAHLLVLATKVAPNVPRSPTILSDLRATYTWLNSRTAPAAALLRRHFDQPMFLNVDDADVDAWEWRSARGLMLNLSYDTGDLAGVRQFLTSYEPLLLAAGVSRLKTPRYEFTVYTSDDANSSSPMEICQSFNKMRLDRKLTDIELVPGVPSDDDDDGDVSLCAHVSFLAAAIPHIRTALLSGMQESLPGAKKYDFPGTASGAQAFLEFVYTGQLGYTHPSKGQEAMDVLRDLLELLYVADVWDMPALKSKIAENIVKFELVMPDTYKTIQEDAERYDVTALIEVCRTFERDNRQALASLTQDDEPE